ncbi:AAA family ATPase [Streptacidiphilus sp. PB12-B1b]|uniref:AAA family ATPase n=1 Tax=Streptacidiphilus sp. PB12-B1b TaxID=2705012 RepID=UPI0015F9FA76|nr:ATP-binding protein [Streptacidiphilus sp. PB12-B1b]QMU75141.1 AAA family ATPase [Streptacidiphilus sp. PB12-B1b]
MYLSRVRIDGIKGFRGSRAVDLTLTRPDGSHAGWTVLAGRNSSGKTSLLQAVAVALLSPAQAYPLVPDLPSWRSADPGRIELTLAGTGDAAATVSGRIDSCAEQGDIDVTCTWVVTPGREQIRPNVVWERTGSAPTADGAPAGPFSDPEWEFALLGTVSGFGPFRRMSENARRDGRAFTSLFSEDAALTEGVAWLVDLDHRSLEGNTGAQETRDAVIALLADGLLPDGLQVAGVSSDGLSVRAADGSEFPLAEMSQGVRTAVALAVSLVWELAQDDPGTWFGRHDGHVAVVRPGIVLIDEVDAHLHVTWQQRIGYWLTSRFPRVQFVVTTHSPYICQAADPGGLIRLGSATDGTAPEVVDEELYRRVVYGSGDDAIMSELFGLETPYSAVAEDARRRIGDLEGRVLSGDASGDELAEYEALSSRLNSSLSARVDEVAGRLARGR